MPRFRELGVIANFQPLWAYADDLHHRADDSVHRPERSS